MYLVSHVGMNGGRTTRRFRAYKCKCFWIAEDASSRSTALLTADGKLPRGEVQERYKGGCEKRPSQSMKIKDHMR